MDAFTTEQVELATKAPLVETITTSGDVYLGWLKPGDDETSTEVRVCKIVKGTAGGNVQYYTKWANGNKHFAHSWALRATLTYEFEK